MWKTHLNPQISTFVVVHNLFISCVFLLTAVVDKLLFIYFGYQLVDDILQ
jgi:hypothetical protein